MGAKIIGTVSVVYLLISLFLVTFCDPTERNDSTAADDWLEHNHKVSQILVKKYHANAFSKNVKNIEHVPYKNILQYNQVFDTTITDVKKVGDDYLISANINGDFDGTVKAKLRCDKSTAEKIKEFKSTFAHLAAKINSIRVKDVTEEAIQIDGKKIYVNFGKEMVLNGYCYEAVETPALMEYKN